MKTDYSFWIKALEDFKSSVEKDLEEIRHSKAEMQQMKIDLAEQFGKGLIYRDEDRIVISAPEIIIGNVTKDGVLNTSAPSRVIIRSNDISLEGVGGIRAGQGTITNRATRIENICVDPGIDGNEEVVAYNSQYSVQACSIALQSEDSEGVFTSIPSASNGEISLCADRHIQMNALLPCENRGKKIDDIIKRKQNMKDSLKSSADKLKAEVDATKKALDKLLETDDGMFDDEFAIRTDCVNLVDLHNQIESAVIALTAQLCRCSESFSQLAEVNRQITCLKEKKKEIDGYKSNYKKQSTGASVGIVAEHTSIASIDGDGNIRDNEGAGLNILAKEVIVHSTDGKGAVMDKSAVKVLTQSVELSTVNPKIEDKSTAYPVEGDVHIISKNIVMEAVDYELKDDKIEEKALTKDGSLKIRIENVEVATNDTEGKASGKFDLNSKSISLKSMDVDKEKRTDKALAKDSTMILVSDKMFAGGVDKDNQSQSVQISSGKVGIFGKTTAEIQQDEAKAVLQLDGGNVAISGSKTVLFGETTVNGKTTFKGETTTGKATVNNIEIKTSFKSPCTTEGFAAPASPSTAKISAKLKKEDAPKSGSK